MIIIHIPEFCQNEPPLISWTPPYSLEIIDSYPLLSREERKNCQNRKKRARLKQTKRFNVTYCSRGGVRISRDGSALKPSTQGCAAERAATKPLCLHTLRAEPVKADCFDVLHSSVSPTAGSGSWMWQSMKNMENKIHFTCWEQILMIF